MNYRNTMKISIYLSLALSCLPLISSENKLNNHLENIKTSTCKIMESTHEYLKDYLWSNGLKDDYNCRGDLFRAISESENPDIFNIFLGWCLENISKMEKMTQVITTVLTKTIEWLEECDEDDDDTEEAIMKMSRKHRKHMLIITENFYDCIKIIREHPELAIVALEETVEHQKELDEKYA